MTNDKNTKQLPLTEMERAIATRDLRERLEEAEAEMLNANATLGGVVLTLQKDGDMDGANAVGEIYSLVERAIVALRKAPVWP